MGHPYIGPPYAISGMITMPAMPSAIAIPHVSTREELLMERLDKVEDIFAALMILEETEEKNVAIIRSGNISTFENTVPGK